MAAPQHTVIQNWAFYKFVRLNDALELKTKMKALGLSPEVPLRGTILLAQEGINAMIAGPEESLKPLKEFLDSDARFQNLDIKISQSDYQPFTRYLVKVKKEIIPMGIAQIQPDLKTGERLSAEELKKWFDEGKKFTLIDTRNDFEIEAGTFRGAKDFGLQKFRQFGQKLESRKEELKDLGKSEPIVMFCTGGIRCEKATALAQELGIPNVYQLDGGILRYLENSRDHFNGECFVFDRRITV